MSSVTATDAVVPGAYACDARSIRETIARYCRYRDEWRFDEMLDELFHEDAIMVGKDTIAVGREEIRVMMKGGTNRAGNPLAFFGSACRHIICNSIINIEGGFARVVSDVLNTQIHEGRFIITNVARYEDQFVKRADNRWWYILKRPHASWREDGKTNWA